MNKVILMGRLVADPEVRYAQGDNATCIARYRLAVDRRFKKADEPEADFISCVAFGKNGEFAEKYLHKGMKIAVVGRIQTGSYTNKDGQKVYTTDIVCEEHFFCESKDNGADLPHNTTTNQGNGGFTSVPNGIDEDLPFARPNSGFDLPFH